MAVFDDLNPPVERLEDPEARQAERIIREGKGIDVKKKSSGVKISTYQKSLAVLNLIFGFGVVAAVILAAVLGVYFFLNG